MLYLNRVSIKSIRKKAPCELYKGKRPYISYFRIVGSKCFTINNGKDFLGKFDAKSDEKIFLGYFSQSKSYRVFNKRTLVVEQSVQVIVDDINVNIPKPYEGCDNELEQNFEKNSH